MPFLVIAHRLSTIKNADHIILLDNGEVKEDGSFQELLDQNGIFASFVERQQIK